MDPDPGSESTFVFRLDPDPPKTDADPKHWLQGIRSRFLAVWTFVLSELRHKPTAPLASQSWATNSSSTFRFSRLVVKCVAQFATCGCSLPAKKRALLHLWHVPRGKCLTPSCQFQFRRYCTGMRPLYLDQPEPPKYQIHFPFSIN